LDAVRIGAPAAVALGHFRVVGIVLNHGGTDTDIRMEGDTDQNLLFTDASTDRVGIGNNAPHSKLDVTGTGPADGWRLDSASHDGGVDADARHHDLRQRHERHPPIQAA
jgi:hypothetical protein